MSNKELEDKAVDHLRKSIMEAEDEKIISEFYSEIFGDLWCKDIIVSKIYPDK